MPTSGTRVPKGGRSKGSAPKRKAKRTPKSSSASLGAAGYGYTKKGGKKKTTPVYKGGKTKFYTREGRRAFREAPKQTSTSKASPITRRLARSYEKQRDIGLTYTPPEDPVKEKLARKYPAPTGVRIIRALTGDKPGEITPTLEEFGNVAATLGASGAGAAAKGVVRAASAAKTAKATKTAKAARAARTVKKPPKTAPKKVRAKAAVKRPAQKAKARYSKPERKLRSAQRQEKYAHRATNPAVVPAASSDPVRAFAEGTVNADPVKSAKTTARALPATFSYLTDLGGSAIHAAATGNSKPLEAALEEGGKAFKALEPLASGDPEKVKKATENTVGYVFAPLLPRGAVSAPARAAGRAVKGAAKAAASPVTKRVAARSAKAAAVSTKPSRAREVAQTVTQRKDRVGTARIFSEEAHRGRYEAARAAQRVEKKARKSRKVRPNDIDASDALSVVTAYGIGRKGALEQLRQVSRSLDPAEDAPQITNTRRVIEFLERNPKVLDNPKFWDAVDAAKAEVRKTETSPRAKYLNQADVVGEGKILKPEERVPVGARSLTKARTRQEAWNDLSMRQRAAKAEQRKAKEAAAQALEATGARREALTNQAIAHHQRFKQLQDESRALSKQLRKFSKGDRDPTIRARRKHWDKRLVDEFVEETKAKATEKGFEEPTWAAEPRLATEPDAIQASFQSGPRRVHIKTGKAAKRDVVERGYDTYVERTLMAPRIQRGLQRAVRRWTEQMARTKTLDGKTRAVFNGDELRQLQQQGKFDPRKEVAVPSRQIRTALQGEAFDLKQFHSEVTQRIEGEFRGLEAQKGTKYIVVSREAAREFADQINPARSKVEAVTAAFGTATSRIILFNPAWLLSQIPATGFQALAATRFNPVAFAREAYLLERLRHLDPEAYEGISAAAGRAGPVIDQPSNLRIGNEGMSKSKTRKAIRQSWVGRRVDELARAQTLGLMDRWQTGKFREVALSAKALRDLNGASARFKDVLSNQSKLARNMRGKSRLEQLRYLGKNPKELRQHIQHQRDTMGDWHTYSRFEREFAGAFIFYPFVRMSLTWPQRFAKHHPITATALYLLAQEHSNTVEKVLGKDGTEFLDYASGVVFGEDGRPQFLLPGARRFAAPGLNVLSESIAQNNSAGVLRALNPVISAPIFAATGTDPFTGEKSDDSFGESLAKQAVSLAPPARAFDLQRLGEEPSEISKALQKADPTAKRRSLLNPFEPISVKGAKRKARIIRSLDDASAYDSELGQFLKAVDRYGEAEAVKRLKADIKAGKKLSKVGPPDPEGDKEFDRLSKIFYSIKFGSSKEKSSSPFGSNPFAGSNPFGGSSPFSK